MRVRPAEVTSVGILILLTIAAIAPGLIAPGDPLATSPSDAFATPSPSAWWGTDESGRDVFTRVVHGAAPSLLIGVTATAIGMTLALTLGLIAGLGGRAADFIVTRITEILFALPGLLAALVFIAIVGPGVVTTTVAVGISTAPGYARVIRSQVVKVRSSGYVEAAVLQGWGRGRILWHHILPGALGPVFVLATLGVGQAIVWASSLSFLGLGAVPPAAEWGAMLSAGRTYLTSAWWMTVFPGLAIVAAAAATTALGRSVQSRQREDIS